MTKSFHVYVKPDGKSAEIKQGMRLMTALKLAGYEIKSSCGGKASCTDCKVKILNGEENVLDPEFKEIQLLGNVFHITKERLSCQTFVEGDITVDLTDQLAGQVKPQSTVLRKKDQIPAKQKEEKTVKEKEGGLRRPKPFKTD